MFPSRTTFKFVSCNTTYRVFHNFWWYARQGSGRGVRGQGAVKFTCVFWRRGKIMLLTNESRQSSYNPHTMYRWWHAGICICVCIWFFVFDVDWMFRSGTTTNFGGSRASMAAWRRSMCPGAFCYCCCCFVFLGFFVWRISMCPGTFC